MELIYDYPEEVKALYMCGYSFEEAVRIAEISDTGSYDIISRCIELYYGKCENGDYCTLVPNYMELVVDEQQVRDSAVRDLRRHFTRKMRASMEDSPIDGYEAPALDNTPDPLYPKPEKREESSITNNSSDDEELPF